MNFLDGKLEDDAGRLWFNEGSGRLPVPDWAKEQLQPLVGRELVLGVRPEAISDRAHARFDCGENRLSLKATLVQPLGDKMDVYLASERHRHIVAHIDAFAGIHTGEVVEMFVDMARVHFFEPGEVGKRVATNASRGPSGLAG